MPVNDMHWADGRAGRLLANGDTVVADARRTLPISNQWIDALLQDADPGPEHRGAMETAICRDGTASDNAEPGGKG
ncbi:hypothetical protein [Xylanimonas protaetiae]|uniref:hypothetical protein n=1 Tax=Xylanimonas protaetiae TaxID=2509457 RepID=UPI0013ED0C07|nr:hypothetical protein [Xylanimonas protaetiae]